MKTQATTLYPFVPSGPQFARSLAFFAALGFGKLWQHDGLAGLRFGGACFLLQDIDVPEWQTNQMVTFEVADLDAYWSELEAKTWQARSPASSSARRRSSRGVVRSTASTRAASAGTCARVAGEEAGVIAPGITVTPS